MENMTSQIIYLWNQSLWAYSSGGERYVDIVEVDGSNPSMPTNLLLSQVRALSQMVDNELNRG